MATIAYGDSFSVDVSTIPEASLHKLAQFGLTHEMGSVISSKVISWAEAEEKEGRTPSAEAKAAKKVEFQKEKWESILNGTMGDNTRGPRLPPLESIMRRIATSEVKAVLAGMKGADGKALKLPSGKDTVTLGGRAFTAEELVNARLASEKFGPAIRRKAEAELKAAEKAKASAGETEGTEALF